MPASDITVAIPVYNGAHVIGKAIESVLRQTVRPAELLVIDDGSEDRSVDVVSSFASPIIRLERKPHTGLARSRNYALRQARGTYIGFLDADDEYHATYLERVSARIDRADPDLVHTGFYVRNEQGKVIRESLLGSSDTHEVNHFLLTFGNFVSISTVTARVSTLLVLGGFYEGLRVNCGCEDWDMWMRMSGRGRIEFVPEVLVNKRLNRKGPYKRSPELYRKDMNEVVERSVTMLGVKHRDLRNAAFGNLYYLWARTEMEDQHFWRAARFLLDGVRKYPSLPVMIARRRSLARPLRNLKNGVRVTAGRRIAIVQRILPEYRPEFFRQLCEAGASDVDIFYGDPDRNSALMNATSTEGFNAIKVWNLILPGGLYIQPGVIRKVSGSRYGIVIAEFSTSILTNIILCLWRSVTHRHFIWWGSGFDPLFKKAGILPSLKTMVVRYLTGRAEAVITYSEMGMSYYLQMGCPRKNIFVAHNSIDTQRIFSIRTRLLQEREAIRQLSSRHRLGSRQVVLFVGRLIREKNVDLLLQGFHLLLQQQVDAALIIIGEGPERSRLESSAKELGVPAIFTGAIQDKDELGKYFCLASLFVLPGLGGLAINEAMCYELPIVCTLADGTERNTVRNGVNGLIIDKPTPENLSGAMKTILGDNALRKRMGENSLAIIRETGGLQQMVSVFEEAIRFVEQERKV